jgi:hypothetical protein
MSNWNECAGWMLRSIGYITLAKQDLKECTARGVTLNGLGSWFPMLSISFARYHTEWGGWRVQFDAMHTGTAKYPMKHRSLMLALRSGMKGHICADIYYRVTNPKRYNLRKAAA